MKPAFDLSLYLITDPALSAPLGVYEIVRRAVAGGVTMVQLRDPIAKTRRLVDEARTLGALLRPLGIPFVINDRVDIALAAGADGVHVGQSDMRPEDARALIGPDRILGLSITELADLDRSDLSVVDYLGVGPIFQTGTKPDAAQPMGTEGLAAVRRRTPLPIVAIGGIKAENAGEVVIAGADGISVVSAICAAPDPQAASANLAGVVRSAMRG